MISASRDSCAKANVLTKEKAFTAEDAKDAEEKQGQNNCLVKETQGIVGMRNKIGRLAGHPWSLDEGARKKRSPWRTRQLQP
jgi:hypothetical protein